MEEWFHILDNDSTRTEKEWEKYPPRIYENVQRLLDILEKTDTRATFFIIGWIAKKYPDLVRRISDKYDIGSHTMNHQLVWQQSPKEFERDLSDSIKLLEDISGRKIRAFRAPGFSIRKSEGWAFDILAKYNIEYDCSVFPARHSHGGMNIGRKSAPFIFECGGIKIKEFPVSTKRIAGKNIIYSGGGYFRLFPYPLIRRWCSKSEYNLIYIHPRDLDSGQPVIKELGAVRKFKSYYGLSRAEKKFRRLLKDFKFLDITEAEKNIDWNSVPTIKIS